MIAGVCGGIGVYLGVDPTVVRVLYALITIFTGLVPGVLVYLVLMLLIPREPST
jgi:phage shock protein C